MFYNSSNIRGFFSFSGVDWINIAFIAVLEIVLVLLIVRLCIEMASSRIEM